MQKAMPAPRPLYRRADVAQAETVYICEGEKAVEAVNSFGLVATTSSGGSCAAAKTDWSPLGGKTVVVLPDNDKPGEQYLTEVVEQIVQQAPSVVIKVARIKDAWPEIPEKGDAADWSEHFDGQPPEYFREKIESVSHVVERLEVPQSSDAEKPSDRANVPSSLILTRASDVQEESLEWLWPDRFLYGHINIIAGDPGLGKSLIAIDAAARVSSGTPWPDGSPCVQGNVIYATTEDGFADTVKPRLAAAGGKHDNVLFLEGVSYSDGSEGPVYLDEHICHLDWYLSESEGVKLLILDTLQSFIGERINTHSNSSSRRIMTPLKRLAEKHRVAILCIEHLTKASTLKTDNATYRIQGSIAFTGAARSVWIVCHDPNDKNRRILQASKTNLAPDGEGLGLSFTIAGPTGRPFLVWGETSISTPISDLLSGDSQNGGDDAASELQRACEFLRAILTEPRLQSDVKSGYKAEMLSDATIRRAKKHLEITSQQQDRQWYWHPSEAMLAATSQMRNGVEHVSDEHLTFSSDVQ
ncbi:MAG: AAA family ATPase [Planctomycetaceae bacterium]